MIAGRTPLRPEEVRLMNPPKCDDLDYIHFLIAAQKVFTGTEAARCAPEEERAPAHDAFTRLLPRQPPDTEALWQEAKAFVDVGKGLVEKKAPAGKGVLLQQG
jgi:putative transposase